MRARKTKSSALCTCVFASSGFSDIFSLPRIFSSSTHLFCLRCALCQVSSIFLTPSFQGFPQPQAKRTLADHFFLNWIASCRRRASSSSAAPPKPTQPSFLCRRSHLQCRPCQPRECRCRVSRSNLNPPPPSHQIHTSDEEAKLSLSLFFARACFFPGE